MPLERERYVRAEAGKTNIRSEKQNAIEVWEIMNGSALRDLELIL